MKKTIRWIGLLIIFFSPLDSFKILGSYFSIYRVLILTLIPLIGVDVFLSRRGKLIFPYKQRKVLIFVLIAFDFICIALSKNKTFGASYFMNDMLGALIVLEFVYVFRESDYRSLLRIFLWSQLISLAFALYAIFLHFKLNQRIPTEVHLLFLNASLGENEVRLLNSTGTLFPRVFFPYATTLHFDLSVGAAAVISLHLYSENTKRVRFLLLGLVFASLVFLSMQKGPIIAFGFILLLLVYQTGKHQSKSRAFRIVSILTVFVIIVLFGFGKEIVDFTFRRFREFSKSFREGDRHILLIREAIGVWLMNLETFVIGSGYSSYAMMEGRFTLIPESYLCSYATLLAERGFVGTLGTLLFYFYYFRVTKGKHYILHSVLFFILLSFIFYDLRHVQTVWIIYGIAVAVSRSGAGLDTTILLKGRGT